MTARRVQSGRRRTHSASASTSSPMGLGRPRTLADLAARAERRDWDGVFFEDNVFHPTARTFTTVIALAAIALATERIPWDRIAPPAWEDVNPDDVRPSAPT